MLRMNVHRWTSLDGGEVIPSARKFCSMAALMVAIGLSGCVYRFTNLHVAAPEGIRTVAVEAVYDASREILPHELLWEELQRTIAAEGHLMLAKASKADALLRVKIKNARFSPTGTVVKPQTLTKDPAAISPTQESLPDYREFRTLTEAAELMPSTAVMIEVDVQLWHLTNRKLLFERSYVQTESFLSVRPSTSPRNNYLRENEAFRSDFARMAKSISERVVSDLLIKAS
ncbi:hypothetical protein EBZ80_02790 [bacterium]|nr:hypothetical protein [bacterium]